MGLSIHSLFARGPAPLLGIDFSASSVKVVELVPGRQSAMRLERYAIEPIERGAIVDGNVEKPEVVAEALLRALRKAGISTRTAALALPSSSVITKRITLPAGMRDDDYEMQVESEASQYIPFAIDEVNLDFQILGPSANSPDDVDVLLAASRKEKVDDRVVVAEMAGLKPMIIDVEPYAARTSIDHIVGFLPNHGEGLILAVFDIGQMSTSLTVVLNGQTIFEREQAFGGNQLTQDIVRLYGLTPEEAELKKRTGDLPDNYDKELLQPFVDQGATDISRSLQFFFTSTPYTRVDRIFLAGGGAVTPGLREAVAQRSSVPTEIFSPFQGMEISSNVREKQMRLDAPAMLVSCGLAMRRFDA
ncbi:MAG: pilus assembly protein PilM [Lautropia sp.]|nr:pilus assembly protein PilM [Lautropia sp.]